MGEKGAKQSAAAAAMAEKLVDELAALGPVTAKKMFGGYGVFADGVMFAIVDSMGDAFLKADDTSVGAFAAAGSARHSRMPYWRVPDAILGSPDDLVGWATTALGVAMTAKE